MGSRTLYITLVIIGLVAAISGIAMKWSSNPSLRDAGPYVGWAGIALLLISRITFGLRRRQPPSSKS